MRHEQIRTGTYFLNVGTRGSFLMAEEQGRLTGCDLGMSFNADARGFGLSHILPFPRETFSEKLLLLGVAPSKATGDTSGFVTSMVKKLAETWHFFSDSKNQRKFTYYLLQFLT